jgi:tetratricopeptide (TPR) repeat protein
MNARDRLKRILSEELAVEYVLGEHSISVKPRDSAGFEVELTEYGDEITVHFEGWHEHFNDVGRALECFLFGLTDRCRLRVSRCGEKPWRWVVESRANETWATSSSAMYYPFSFHFWRRHDTIYRQNHTLSFDSHQEWFWQKHLEWAVAELGAGQLAEAKERFLSLLESAKQLFGPESSRVANVLHNLAEIHRARNEIAEARQLTESALSLLEKAEPNGRYKALVLLTLGEISGAQSRLAEMEDCFSRALTVMERAGAPEYPEVAAVLERLGMLYANAGRWSEALPLLERLLDIRERVLSPDQSELSQALVNLANAYLALEDFPRAEPLFARAIAILEPRWLSHREVSLAYALNGLGHLYEVQTKYDLAEPLYERSLKIREESLGTEHPDVATACNNLAVVYGCLGKHAQAEGLYKRALLISERSQIPADKVAEICRNYAGLLTRVGRHNDAASLHARARSLQSG